MKSKKFILPAEWEPQSAIQLTWPHAQTDWNYMLGDITATYVEMAREIADHERLLIVAPRTDEVKGLLDSALPASSAANIVYHECPTNDTWARDHGFITLKNLDVEGGSIESDGRGTVFTTSQCLLAPHRNQPLTQQRIEQRLKDALCASRIVWLDHGNLIGDDTDGHIDTIVRVAPDDTLLYIGNVSPDDEQYDDFCALEQQLRSLLTDSGKPYRLLSLLMPDAIFDNDGSRLPATYANFLVTNEKVLVPVYGQKANDEAAISTIASAFPGRKMVAIDSRPIIRQHGSIHCCTMQLPLGVVKD